MTKTEMAKKIVADNANASRKEIIALFMSQLNMTKAGATTYAYNLAKGAGKSVRTAKAPKVKVSGPAIKAKNLNTIKQVAAKRSPVESKADKLDRAAKQAVVDNFSEEADAFIKTLTAPARKFISGAE